MGLVPPEPAPGVKPSADPGNNMGDEPHILLDVDQIVTHGNKAFLNSQTLMDGHETMSSVIEGSKLDESTCDVPTTSEEVHICGDGAVGIALVSYESSHATSPAAVAVTPDRKAPEIDACACDRSGFDEQRAVAENGGGGEDSRSPVDIFEGEDVLFLFIFLSLLIVFFRPEGTRASRLRWIHSALNTHYRPIHSLSATQSGA